MGMGEANETGSNPFSTRFIRPGAIPYLLPNGVTLDFLDSDDVPLVEHYAFLLSEAEFDLVFERIRARGLPYWADPGHRRLNQLNHGDGGRGLYWNDPDGHNLEILTRPYGSGGG